MDEWNQEKERTRLFFKPAEGCKPFIGWDKVKIAPYTVEKRTKSKGNSVAETETQSVVTGIGSCRFRFKRGEDCFFCKLFITDEPLKDHVLRCHPNCRRCRDCNFVTEDGLKGLQQHRREMHKIVHECVLCKFSRVDGQALQKHFNSKEHKLVVYQQVMVFNEMVDKFQLPVKKIVPPNLGESESRREMQE